MVAEVSTTWYTTSDGKRFKNREAAEAHENAGKFSDVIDAFINSREWKKGRGTVAKNLITQFLLFRQQQLVAE